MAAIAGRKTELFEETLRSLSVAGFSLVVSHGVRDIDTFLGFDLGVIPDVSPYTVAELSSAQEGLRRRLSAEAALQEEGFTDGPRPQPENACDERLPAGGAGSEEERLGAKG